MVAAGEQPPEKKILPPERREPDAPPPQDDDALKEARQLGSGRPVRDLRKEAEEREHDRGEKFRDSFEFLAIAAMYAIFGVMALIGIVWFAHMIFPEKCTAGNILSEHFCRWLIPEQVIIIQDILTGGIIAGLIADHIKRRMGQ